MRHAECCSFTSIVKRHILIYSTHFNWNIIFVSLHTMWKSSYMLTHAQTSESALKSSYQKNQFKVWTVLCRHSSGAVWPTERRTGSMFTSCARTPTSSLTWDVQTPLAPCSPPPHPFPPTDWLSHTTDRTLCPVSRQDWRKMDVDFVSFFTWAVPQMDKLATEQKQVENMRWKSEKNRKVPLPLYTVYRVASINSAVWDKEKKKMKDG